MNKLCLREGSLWTNLSTDEDEMILCYDDSDLDAIVKARVVPFFGDKLELHDVLKERVTSDASILSYCRENRVFGGWTCDSYVCTKTEDVYRSFYYQILDKFYVVIEMLTGDIKSSAKFRSLVPELINSLDYSLIDECSVITKNGYKIIMHTPSTFRYSRMSNDDRLVFLGESKYLFVGINECDKDLQTLVDEQMDAVNSGLDECRVKKVMFSSSDDFEVVRYSVTELGDGNLQSFGTYFKQRVGPDCFVLSFLLERGEATSDVQSILQIEEVDYER